MNDLQRLTGYRGCDTISDANDHTDLDVAYFIALEDTVVSNLEGHDGQAITKDYIDNTITLPKGLVVTADQVNASGEGWFTRIQLTSGSIMHYDRPQKGKPSRPNQPKSPVA